MQLMRARMKGDKERVAKLEAQLEAARAGVPIGGSEAPAETVEVVSTLDERGRPISILNKAKPSIGRQRQSFIPACGCLHTPHFLRMIVLVIQSERGLENRLKERENKSLC